MNVANYNLHVLCYLSDIVLYFKTILVKALSSINELCVVTYWKDIFNLLLCWYIYIIHI